MAGGVVRILVFGASGYIGRHVAARFVADGHAVTALVRSAAGAATVIRSGAKAVPGDLSSAGDMVRLVQDHDAVVWIAQLMLEEEHRVVHSLLDAIYGTGKTFIFTSGSGLLSERTDGEWSENSYSEDESFIPRRQIAPRLAIENMVRSAAANGERAMCVRPPLVWGNGGSKVIADLYYSAAATGAVCYVGRGLNVYSNVHVEDLADLYSRTVMRGVPGALYHCVSGETNFRTMAEAIAGGLGVPTRSIDVSESVTVWDKFTGPIVFSSCSRTRSKRARLELGWKPTPARSDILEECLDPGYRSDGPRTLPAAVRRD